MAEGTDIYARPMAFTDLETTGLNPFHNEIIEFGLVLVDQTTLEVMEEWETKVQPRYPERANAMVRGINGFNEEEWRDAPSLEQVLPEYAQRVQGALLTAWNIRFEAKFLEAAFHQCRIDIYQIMAYHGMDVIPLAMERLRGTGIKKFSLSTVADALGLEGEPTVHRAINGARLAFEVYKKLREPV
ncbi:MAG: 3'-5' exonuclease [Candidatus Spechtbacterales bacterium]